MGIKYKFIHAQNLLSRASTRDKKDLTEICERIQTAQRALNIGAESLLKGCKENCKGLCCRNVDLEGIITELDFVYILFMGAASEELIEKCFRHETLFTSNCIFLKDGVGPCIFPLDIRPEKCIVTFCEDETPIRGEIKRLTRSFNALSRFVMLSGPRAWLRYLKKIMPMRFPPK